MKGAFLNLALKITRSRRRLRWVAIAVTAVAVCVLIGLFIQAREAALITDLRTRGVILTKGGLTGKSTTQWPGDQKPRFEVGPVLMCTLTAEMGRLQDLAAVSRFKFIQIIRYEPWGNDPGAFFDRQWPDVRQTLTDDFFAPVLGLNRLGAIMIATPSNFTDWTLAGIGKLPDLTYLHLQSEHFTDVGIRKLANLKKLSVLALGNASVGDSLGALPLEQFVELGLQSAKLDADSLVELPRAKNLVVLKLSEASVTNDMLGILARLPSLQRLDLSGTVITAAGLELLGKSPSLRTVHVDNTAITREDAQAFMSRYSSVNVYGFQGEVIERPEE
jgi:hypothetical protein